MVPALALLFAVIWMQYGLVTITYEGVPSDVTGIRLYEWKDDGPPIPVDGTISRRGADVVVTAAARMSVVAVLARKGNEYLLDGPFALARDERRPLVDLLWRRSGRGALPSGTREGSVQWIGARSAGPWPRCVRAAAAWECWGIDASDHGVTTFLSEGRLWWTAANPATADGWRSAAWGRLVTIYDSVPASSKIEITLAHPITSSSSRFAGVRLETRLVPDAGVTFLLPNVAWVFGELIPPKAWMEVRSATGGPAFVSLEEAAGGSAMVPLEVRLSDTRTITGTITGLGGQRAANALVTMFRLIDPQPPPGSPSKPRRVFAAEQTADDDGEFSIGGRGDAEYEIVAWHPQLGRASVPLEDAHERIDIKLDAPGLVRGRVVSRGRPIAGVEIVSVPDTETMMRARDVTEVKGGDARTGPDGRFVVALAPSPGGELRIGGGAYAIRRVPLPRSPASSLDLGDIELEAPIDLLIVIEGDPGCTLQAVGPIGKMGLQVVNAVREPGGHRLAVAEPGIWQFGLTCATGRRLLLPDSVQVTRAMAGTLVQFTVR